MKKPKSQKFVFEISIDAIPHTSETVEYVFGGKFYNPDFGIQTHASEKVFTVLNDALCGFLHAELKHLAECKCEVEDMNENQKRFYDYLHRKTKSAEVVRDSMKFVRSEEIE